MWFKNLQVFRIRLGVGFEELESRCADRALTPCTGAQTVTLGWVPHQPEGAFVHGVNRQWLIALGAEEKLLPASVIRQHAQERASAIEKNEGRRVGRREFRELQEQALQELLPRAFVRRRTTYAWINPAAGWLAIDSASPARADELLEQLHRSIDGVLIAPIKLLRSPASAMTGWLADSAAPTGFSIDKDTELQSAEHAIVRYAKHALDGEDIPAHIAAGKIVTRLGMTWADKISFVLTENLQLKRLAFLDILKEAADDQAENEAERFDIDFTLMTGELAKLLADLIEALGGEMREVA